MQERQSWQQAAVTLFSAATARLNNDARQLGETVGWTRAAPAGVTLRNQVSWLTTQLRSVGDR